VLTLGAFAINGSPVNWPDDLKSTHLLPVSHRSDVDTFISMNLLLETSDIFYLSCGAVSLVVTNALKIHCLFLSSVTRQNLGVVE
jgi:hypothetical protein